MTIKTTRRIVLLVAIAASCLLLAILRRTYMLHDLAVNGKVITGQVVSKKACTGGRKNKFLGILVNGKIYQYNMKMKNCDSFELNQIVKVKVSPEWNLICLEGDSEIREIVMIIILLAFVFFSAGVFIFCDISGI